MTKTLIDNCFYVEQTDWKTWKSYDKENKPLITSLTEESCISATRHYCKWLQDGFPETKQYDGKVDGKL